MLLETDESNEASNALRALYDQTGVACAPSRPSPSPTCVASWAFLLPEILPDVKRQRPNRPS